MVRISKPRTMKEALRELIDHCEECGSSRINIMEFEVYERNKRKGFLASIGECLVPSDPVERRRYEKRKELENREGMLIQYHCMNCNCSFEQFYSLNALWAWLQVMKSK